MPVSVATTISIYPSSLTKIMICYNSRSTQYKDRENYIEITELNPKNMPLRNICTYICREGEGSIG